jgi:hypothetical protein
MNVLRELEAINKERARLFDSLNRFVRAGDASLTDADLVYTVYARWIAYRKDHIGDCSDGVDLKGLFK